MSVEETQQEPEGSGVQKTPEQFLADEKRSIRRKSYWAVGIGALLVVAHVAWLAVFALLGADVDLSILGRSIFFILGLFALAAGLYGLYQAHKLTIDDYIPSAEAIAFARGATSPTPYYTFIILGAMFVAFLVQGSGPLELSRNEAGFVRERITAGEYWRLLTAGVLHGGFIHILLNGNALYGLGSLFEFLSNRAHLAIVFVLAILGGSLSSYFFGPFEYALGASGGILGIFGYLLIYASRRRAQLPPGFLKNLLVNAVFIAGFGLVGYQFIDNFAHLGGFAVGVVYAYVQVPRQLESDPRQTSRTVEILGMIAVAVYLAEALFAIMRITGRA